MAVEINYELRYDLTVEPPIKGPLEEKQTLQKGQFAGLS